MKGYISDQITGLPFEEAFKNFEAAENLLRDIGIEPVNPMKNGLPYEATWKEHMLRDIELLMDCDAIMMCERWMVSKGARIEKAIAEAMGKLIIYSTNVERENENIAAVKSAIEEASGLTFEAYTTTSRERNGYFARMIFANVCIERCEDVNTDDIANMLNRNKTIVRRYLNNFDGEYKHNREFRALVKAVKINLTKYVSE